MFTFLGLTFASSALFFVGNPVLGGVFGVAALVNRLTARK